MQYHEFVSRLGQRDGIDNPEQVSSVVLEELGRRLAGQEPSQLAAQLPAELKQPLNKHTGAADKFDVDEFFRRIADREGSGPDYGRAHAAAVLGTTATFDSGGELDDVRSQIPGGFRQLLG